MRNVASKWHLRELNVVLPIDLLNRKMLHGISIKVAGDRRKSLIDSQYINPAAVVELPFLGSLLADSYMLRLQGIPRPSYLSTTLPLTSVTLIRISSSVIVYFLLCRDRVSEVSELRADCSSWIRREINATKKEHIQISRNYHCQLVGLCVVVSGPSSELEPSAINFFFMAM